MQSSSTATNFDAITYMLDEIIMAGMMTPLDLEFGKAMHYHEEGYKSDNDYGLPAQFMRPVKIYSVSTQLSGDASNPTLAT